MLYPWKLADAKARFSEPVQKAMLGESVIVTKENRPVVKIVAIKPARRMPVAQAQEEGISLVSRDPAFDGYGIKRIW